MLRRQGRGRLRPAARLSRVRQPWEPLPFSGAGADRPKDSTVRGATYAPEHSSGGIADWIGASYRDYQFNLRTASGTASFDQFSVLLSAQLRNQTVSYNTVRPHSALGYRPPAPETLQPCVVATATPPQPHRAGLLEGKTLT